MLGNVEDCCMTARTTAFLRVKGFLNVVTKLKENGLRVHHNMESKKLDFEANDCTVWCRYLKTFTSKAQK